MDTSPNVTRVISDLSVMPEGCTEVGAFAHPTRPEVAGKLVRFHESGRYAIVSGRTLVTVPRDWAQAQELGLSWTVADTSTED